MHFGSGTVVLLIPFSFHCKIILKLYQSTSLSSRLTGDRACSLYGLPTHIFHL